MRKENIFSHSALLYIKQIDCLKTHHTNSPPFHRKNCEHLCQKFVNLSRFCDNFSQIRLFSSTYHLFRSAYTAIASRMNTARPSPYLSMFFVKRSSSTYICPSPLKASSE